jgi:hypothetical protein
MRLFDKLCSLQTENERINIYGPGEKTKNLDYFILKSKYGYRKKKNNHTRYDDQKSARTIYDKNKFKFNLTVQV